MSPSVKRQKVGEVEYDDATMKECVRVYVAYKIGLVHAATKRNSGRNVNLEAKDMSSALRMNNDEVVEWKNLLVQSVDSVTRDMVEEAKFMERVARNGSKHVAKEPLVVVCSTRRSAPSRNSTVDGVDEIRDFVESLVGVDVESPMVPSLVGKKITERVSYSSLFECDTDDASYGSLVVEDPRKLVHVGYLIKFDKEPLFEVKKSGIEGGGYGLFAARSFQIGSCLGLYWGDVKMNEPKLLDERLYTIQVMASKLNVKMGRTPRHGNVWIVSSKVGGASSPIYFGLHFVNDPKYCISKRIGTNAMVCSDGIFYATKTIERGSEVFIHYEEGEAQMEIASVDAVGTKVKKFFDGPGEVFHGEVVSVKNNEDGEVLYGIKYSDNDEEDFSNQDLRKHMYDGQSKYKAGDGVLEKNRSGKVVKYVVDGFRIAEISGSGKSKVVDEEWMERHCVTKGEFDEYDGTD